jgi:hypothetical protein
MNSRREALITIAGVTAVTSAAAQQNAHQHADAQTPQPGDKPKIDDKKPRQAKFFKAEEFATLGVLVDIIIPRTDTPGASDAGVHYIIDERVPRDERVRKQWRDGIAKFRKTPKGEQLALMTKLSKADDPFFLLLKGAVIDAYYSTREGLAVELGWHGNQALSEFKGCTHPEHQA